jgi:hypothetical protein
MRPFVADGMMTSWAFPFLELDFGVAGKPFQFGGSIFPENWCAVWRALASMRMRIDNSWLAGRAEREAGWRVFRSFVVVMHPAGRCVCVCVCVCVL